MERIRDLAHVEMFGDKVDESLDFFTHIFGLTLSGRDETSAYLWRGTTMNSARSSWRDTPRPASAISPSAPH